MLCDDKLTTAFQEFLHSGEPIDSEKPLRYFGIDSLRQVELLVFLEEKFNIQFSESDLDPAKISTFNDVENLIKKYI